MAPESLQEPPILYTVPEAAERLRISERTMTRLINEGTIRSCKIGYRRMVHRTHLDEYVNRVAGLA